MNTPTASIVIPVFNKWELTENCLTSLRSHTSDNDAEVIVVDNASSDATATNLEPLGKALFGPRFRRIRFEENRNFGPACNAGAKAAAAGILFFLNNDTLLTPNWLPPLLDSLGDQEKHVVGPLLLYENGSVQHMGVCFSLHGPTHLYRGFPADHAAVRRPRPLRALTAAALMLRKSFFFAAEGFYEAYANGFEDVDLCLRLKEMGARFLLAPDSVIYHLESRTPGRHAQEARNTELLNERCRSICRPDIHRHALLDGFEPFVTDRLTLGVRMRQKDENALLQSAGDDPEALEVLTAQNPLWISGRMKKASELEAEGRFSEALPLRAQIARISQTEDSYLRLRRLGELTGNEAAVTWAGKALPFFEDCRANPQSAALHMQTALRMVQEYGDAMLEDMFQAKRMELRAALK